MGWSNEMDAMFCLKVGEKRDFVIDTSDLWADDTIASVVWTVPAGLTGSQQTNTTTTATIWLERTLAGSLVVTAKLTSAGGRVEIIQWMFTE